MKALKTTAGITLVLLAGCALVTRTVSPEPTRGQLSSLAPLKVRIGAVSDERSHGKGKDWVGDCVRSSRPLDEIVRDNLADCFRTNGHEVVDSGPADLEISAVVREMFVTIASGMFHHEFNAGGMIVVTVSDLRGSDRTWSKEYRSARHETTGTGRTCQAYEAGLITSLLQDIADQMVNDPDLVQR